MAFEVMTRISGRSAPEFEDMVAPIQDKYPGSGRNLKWVLMGLADYANKEGFCWPSVGTLEEFSGLTTRSVQRALKQAEVLGLLKVKRRMNASSQYIFNLEKLPYVERPTRWKEKGPHSENIEWDEPDLFQPVDVDLTAGLKPAVVVIADDVEEGCHDGTPASEDNDPRQTGTPPPPVSAITPASVAPKPVIEPSVEPPEEPGTEVSVRPDISLPLAKFIVAEWAALKGEVGDTISSLRTMTNSMLELARTQARLHSVDGQSDQEVWKIIFDEIRKSRFLTGRAPPGHGKSTSFRLSFSRLIKPHIFREVINGAYASNGADDGNFDPVTGEVLGPAGKAASATIARIQSARERG